MTKKSKKAEKKQLSSPTAEPENPEETDLDEEDLPVRVGVYSQQELAFGDMMRAIFSALSRAYREGMTRKELRRASGVKKKTLRRIESMDLSTPLGDVLRVLAAANKTLAVVPLNGMTPENAARDTMAELEEALTAPDPQPDESEAEQPDIPEARD